MSLERGLRRAQIKAKDFALTSPRIEVPRSFILKEFAMSGTEMIDIEDPEGNVDKFYFLKQGKYPIIIFNHLSLADVGAAVKISSLLNRVGNPHLDFNMPVSISLEGKQGLFVKTFYDAVKPWLRKQRIEVYEVARYKDRKDYGYDPTEEVNQDLHNTVYTDRGLMIFMEGEQTGGRINQQTGFENGMIEVKNYQVPEQMLSSIQFGREVAFLPIGIHGTNRLLNPDNRQLTREALECMVYQKFGADPKLATATVGPPFTSDDICKEGITPDDFEGVNTYLMKQIARLIPEDLRGFYR